MQLTVTNWGFTHKVNVKISKYIDNDNTAIMLECADGDEIGEPYGTATVNIIELPPNLVTLDTNNMPGIMRDLEDGGYIEPLYHSVRSGYCEYPVVELTDKFFAELEEKDYYV